jgi:excisionase family DNA binding protein
MGCASRPEVQFVDAPRKWLTVAEAAGRLGVSDSLVYELFRDGDLEGYRVRRRIFIYADSVEAFIQRNANRLKEALPPLPVEVQPRPPKRSAAAGAFRPFRHLR